MKMTNLQIVISGIAATALFDIVVLSGFHPFFAGSAYAFLYLSIVPGFFMQRLLRMQGIALFELLMYSVGLSIIYLFLVGISTNLLGLLPHLSQPLTMPNSLAMFNLYTILLLLINVVREKTAFLHVAMPQIPLLHVFFYAISLFFPVLSILGVQLLNTHGVNILIMILLCSVAAYILLLAIFARQLAQFAFEIPIYLVAISFLFLFSLRSSYIIGWDIYTEYRVFLLTESNQVWSMANYQDAYNACLSITLLPTLFHYFTKVDNAFVFKILFQCLFAWTPVTIYALARKFTTPLLAFLSAFFFIATVDFFRELPALIRQEIAYLFFGLLLLTLFNKRLPPFKKNILFVVFSCSIILSHYSTAYILVALLVFSCACLTVYASIARKFLHREPGEFTLKPLLVLLVVVFAFVWFGPITNIAGNIFNALSETSANLSNFGQYTQNTSLFDQFFASGDDNPQVLLRQEISDASREYSQDHFTYYPKSTYKDYVPAIIDKDISPLHVSRQIGNIIYFADFSLIKIMKILIIFGFVATIILFQKKLFSAEYSILSLGFAIALLLITSVPAISLLYPIGRLDQQTLFFIALPAILTCSWLLRSIPDNTRMILITALFVTYFLFTYTVIPQIIGGQDPEAILNNSGLYYNEVYLHPSELASIHWLDANNKEQAPVFADIGSNEKMHGYSNHKYSVTYMNVFPSLIAENSYVYANYANTLYGIGITNPKDTRMEYNFPNDFLNTHKNLIYSNYDTHIYK